jgi:hypothetical protein
MRRMVQVLILVEAEILLLSWFSRPTLEPTQPPSQWVRVFPPLGQSGRDVMSKTHLHLVPCIIMSISTPLLLLYALIVLTGTDLSFLPLYMCVGLHWQCRYNAEYKGKLLKSEMQITFSGAPGWWSPVKAHRSHNHSQALLCTQYHVPQTWLYYLLNHEALNDVTST